MGILSSSISQQLLLSSTASFIYQPLQNKLETPSKLIRTRQQEMRILSGSISQQLLSSTASSILLPRIQTLRARTPPPTMCLQQHQNNNNNNKLLVSHMHKGSLAFSILSTEEDDNRIMNTFPGFEWPVANCHELVLTPTFDRHSDPTILNPSTKEVIKTLPKPSRPPTSLVYYEWVRLYGMGLDPKTSSSDYKVVRFLEFDYEDKAKSLYMDHYLAELYSLKTDSWKQIAYPHADHGFPVPLDVIPIYINGFNYWTASAGEYGKDLVIISFDFANESFPSALIPGPSAYKLSVGYKLEWYHFLLAEFEGSLALVVYLIKDKLFELWVWNNDDGSWSRRREWAVGVDVSYLLGFLKNDQFYFQDSKGELVLFDCANQKLKNLRVYAENDTLTVFP